ILLRCYSLGLDLNRYVIASQRIETAEKNLIGAALPTDVDPRGLCDRVHKGEPVASESEGDGAQAPPF
ncbi:MAG TPA: hypothetical protein VJY40_06995, partial [Corynebacterium sp.]|nr:hypothetical protein [Corynebacterium sp.]